MVSFAQPGKREMINGGACQLSLLRNGIQILEEYQQFVFFTFLFLPFTKVVNSKLHPFEQKSEKYQQFCFAFYIFVLLNIIKQT